MWEKILPRLVAPLLSGIRMLNTVFRTENCSKSSSELTICEISDSKNFDFSATSSGTEKKVSDFFLQNPKTFNNFLSNELSDVFELPKLKSWDRLQKGEKISPLSAAAEIHALRENIVKIVLFWLVLPCFWLVLPCFWLVLPLFVLFLSVFVKNVVNFLH